MALGSPSHGMGDIPSTSSYDRGMWTRPLIKNVSILAACQAMFFMANTILISTSPLVGLKLAPSPIWTTFPLGVNFVGTMLTVVPASYLMRAVGRSYGLAAGCLLGIAAGVTGTYAIMAADFAIFIAASFLYGCFSAFCQFYRFTAADAADAGDKTGKARPRAISLVLAGGVVAAFLGPELAKLTKDAIPSATLAGCYVAIAALATLSGMALLALDRLKPVADHLDGSTRSALTIFRQPLARTALFSAIAAYLTMNLLMTATPLAMQHVGHLFESTAFVIQWHVLGMFAPSFFTGTLIARFGEHRLIAAGSLLLLAAVVVNLAGVALTHFTLALLLLGIGWNFMFIGGTTLLTHCYRPAEKAKAQGVNDLILFSMVALSATSSGALHHLIGWQNMNIAVLPLLIASLAMTLLRPGSATWSKTA